MSAETSEQAEHARGYAEGARLERERCKAILESPEAEGRWQAAKVLALATGMEPEAARLALARMPQDPAPEAALGTALFARSRP